MDIWKLFNTLNHWSTKYLVSIDITCIGKDLLGIHLREMSFVSGALPYSKSTEWNYMREDEYEFLSRLELMLEKFSVEATEWRAKLFNEKEK